MSIDGPRMDSHVLVDDKTSSWEVLHGPGFGELFDNPHAFGA